MQLSPQHLGHQTVNFISNQGTKSCDRSKIVAPLADQGLQRNLLGAADAASLATKEGGSAEPRSMILTFPSVCIFRARANQGRWLHKAFQNSCASRCLPSTQPITPTAQMQVAGSPKRIACLMVKRGCARRTSAARAREA